MLARSNSIDFKQSSIQPSNCWSLMRVMARLVKSLGFDGSFCILLVSEWATMGRKGDLVSCTLENKEPPPLCTRHFGSTWVQSARMVSRL